MSRARQRFPANRMDLFFFLNDIEVKKKGGKEVVLMMPEEAFLPWSLEHVGINLLLFVLVMQCFKDGL